MSYGRHLQQQICLEELRKRISFHNANPVTYNVFFYSHYKNCEVKY